MADPEEGAEPKKGKGKVIVLILALGLLLGGGGLGAYVMMAAGKANSDTPKDDDGDAKEADVKVEKAKIITLKPMVVNLRGTRGTRYLKVTIGLETRAEKVAEELNEKSVPLKDFLIDRLSNLQISDIDTSLGRNKLKRELMGGINDLLEGGMVEKLYFSEFVMQ